MPVCVLDLVMLEGIYPPLAQGVGIPTEQRTRNSTLPWVVMGLLRARSEKVRNWKGAEFLRPVITTFVELCSGEHVAGEGYLLQRTGERAFVQGITVCAEMVFHP
ncbi:unnamed protein product, partial [Tuber aestivum]